MLAGPARHASISATAYRKRAFMDDFHTHSTASDGALTPAGLVARAAARGVTRLALTDHDTVAGVSKAIKAAAGHDLAVIPSVEISADWLGRTVHIVGLDVNPRQRALADGLARHQAQRRERARQMAERLARYGLADGFQRTATAAAGGQITRAHFANLLVADGLCRHVNDAFKRFLRPGKAGHVRADWADMATVVTWIHAAGGQAVLAHPFGYRATAGWRRRVIAAFAAAGGNALEICTGTTTCEQEQQAARAAAGHGLAGSTGSDFHAPDQIWRDVGRLHPLPAVCRPVMPGRTTEGT